MKWIIGLLLLGGCAISEKQRYNAMIWEQMKGWCIIQNISYEQCRVRYHKWKGGIR